MDKMMNTVFLFLLYLVTNTKPLVCGVSTTVVSKEDLELERQLNIINKSPIKSIKTKNGYIIDCVDINKQPAFDHPLLKNHKLQRNPKFATTAGKTSFNVSPTKFKLELEKVICPTGTVPIRRTTKNNLIHSKVLLNNNSFSIDANFGIHRAQYSLKKGPYYGITGITSVYNPRVYKDQSSTSQVFVGRGQKGGVNQIIAGWHVYPNLYGNDRSHIFIAWTSDSFQKTGCYNIFCSGFVQINNKYAIGSTISNTSTYGGLMVELPISLAQDIVDQNWYLFLVNVKIGYFPAALFSNLRGADQIGWGGITINPVGSQSPPMGSSYFPDLNFLHSCYFKNIGFFNETRKISDPPYNLMEKFVDAPNCYAIEYYGTQQPPFDFSLQFGGPGGNC